MLKEHVCANCTAYKAINADVGVCRAHPPVPTLLGIAEQPSPLAGGQSKMVPQLEYYQPITTKDRWCREYEEAPRYVVPNLSKQ